MSEISRNSKEITVKCTKCEQESTATIYGCFNATEENGLIQKVKDGSIFRHKCPGCGQEINLEYSFLYNQVNDALMIHYLIKDEEVAKVAACLSNPNEEQMQAVKSFLKNNTIIRIVRSKAQLYEKLAIYDSGADDRVIEILKVIVSTKFLKENPDKKIKYIFYNLKVKPGSDVDDESTRIIQIYCEDNSMAEAVVDDTLYKKIFDDYVSGMPVLRADRNLLVNNSWARRMIELKNATPNPAE